MGWIYPWRKKRRKAETIRDEVKNWVAKVDGIEKEVSTFMEVEEKSKKICFGGFPDFIMRYRLAKEVKQKTLKVMELYNEGVFNIISIPTPPPEITEFLDSRDTQVYKTTEDVLTKVMEALKDNNINFIGIHGMGGVGKTTLAKSIIKSVRKDFDKVLMVVISQNDVRTIQGQLRDQLGVNLSDESELGIAHRLKTCLKNLKKVLLILDDVWDVLDFEAVGIPFGDDHKGCKVIITSRDESLCKILGRERWKPKLIPLDCLSDQESWDLFKTIAPDVIGDSKLSKVAQEISRECRGLPRALVTFGCALTGKDLDEWEMAAQELKKSASMNIPAVVDKALASFGKLLLREIQGKGSEEVIQELKTKLDEAEQEKTNFQLQLHEANQKNEDLEQLNNDIQSQLSNLVETKNNLTEERDKLQCQNEELQQQLQQQSEESKQQQQDLKKLANQLQKQHEVYQTAIATISKFEKENRQLKEQAKTLIEVIQELKAKLAKAEQEMSNLQLQLHEANQINEDLKQLNNDIRSQLSDLVETENNLTEERDKLRCQNEKLQQQLQQQSEENKQQQQDLEKLANQLQKQYEVYRTAIATVSKFENENQKLKEQAKTLTEVIQELKAKLAEAEQEMTNLKLKLQQVNQINEDHKQRNNVLRSQLRRLRGLPI